MKSYCLELAARQTGFDAKLNIIREYLQAYVLRIMHDEGMFRNIAFLGGTALRFMYGLPRFSEDLDFSVTDNRKCPFIGLIKRIKKELILAGYNISITYNDRKAVHYAFIKFPELMYEAGISSLKQQKLSIKIEIDVNPPKGAVLKTDIVNKYFPISFLSYDLASLFSGKLHALLNRKYTKGRDFFDLGWYLSKWKDLSPNIPLLQNALRQTRWNGRLPVDDDWRDFLCGVLKKADWTKVRQDVESCLDNPKDVDIFTKQNVLNLIKHK